MKREQSAQTGKQYQKDQDSQEKEKERMELIQSLTSWSLWSQLPSVKEKERPDANSQDQILNGLEVIESGLGEILRMNVSLLI